MPSSELYDFYDIFLIFSLKHFALITTNQQSIQVTTWSYLAKSSLQNLRGKKKAWDLTLDFMTLNKFSINYDRLSFVSNFTRRRMTHRLNV